MRVRDPFLFSYFRACGGKERDYPKYARAMGIVPDPTRTRYSKGALLTTTLTMLRSLTNHPERVSEAALKEANERVRRAANTLVERYKLKDKSTRRRQEAALFYATARRDAMQLALADIEPGNPTLPENTIISSRRRPEGVSKRLRNARYALKAQVRMEPVLVIEAEDATDMARAAQLQYDRMKAALVIAQDEAEHELMARRASGAYVAVRHRPGTRANLNTQLENVRSQRRIVAKLAPSAHAKRQRLAKCRAKITELRATIAELEKQF